MERKAIITMEVMRQKYSSQIIKLDSGEEVKFRSYEDLANFTATYFIGEYLSILTQNKVQARKSACDFEVWKRQLNEVSTIYDSFKVYIFEQCMKYEQRKDRKSIWKDYSIIIIDAKRNSKIYKIPLKIMEEKLLPQCAFPLMTTFKIDLKKLTFSKVR